MLDEAIDQQLEFVVKNTRSAHDLRAVGHRLGIATVPLADIARCPNGKARPIRRLCAVHAMPHTSCCSCQHRKSVSRSCPHTGQALANHGANKSSDSVQVVESTLDLQHPHHPHVSTGVLVVSLAWIPLNPGCPMPTPSPLLARLPPATRGDLFVRVVRAHHLPVMDHHARSSNASVRLRSTGQEHVTTCAEGLAPVWLEAARLDCLAPHSSVHVIVQHEAHRRMSESGRLDGFVSRPVRCMSHATLRLFGELSPSLGSVCCPCWLLVGVAQSRQPWSDVLQ